MSDSDSVDQNCVDRLRQRLLDHDSILPLQVTTTTKAQSKAQQLTVNHFQSFLDQLEISPKAVLHRDKIHAYCLKGLAEMGQAYESLDASRPWLIYWTIHALDLLDYDLPEERKEEICQFLELCQSPTGGFGGGPGQMAHLATTYAAMNSIAILGANNFTRAYQVVDREKMFEFIQSVRQEDGSFSMHVNGERDTRAVYCAASIATMLQFDLSSIFTNSIQYLLSCQSWDGGFGPSPGSESHGGYTYTSLAALTMIGGIKKIRNIDNLLRWLAGRQMRVEGGFNGRSNKLVDSCYNFWQGGSFPIVQGLIPDQHRPKGTWLCDCNALQEYTLFAAQQRRNGLFIGGFTDRPGNNRDYYHTCYALSGLSVMQHVYGSDGSISHLIVGHPENEISMTNPLHNVRPACVIEIYDYFKYIRDQNS